MSRNNAHLWKEQTASMRRKQRKDKSGDDAAAVAKTGGRTQDAGEEVEEEGSERSNERIITMNTSQIKGKKEWMKW